MTPPDRRQTRPRARHRQPAHGRRGRGRPRRSCARAGAGLPGVAVVDGGTGGFHLLEYFSDYDPVVLIDATMDGRPAGTVTVLERRATRRTSRASLTAHDIGLRDLIEAAVLTGPLPQLWLVTVSIAGDAADADRDCRRRSRRPFRASSRRVRRLATGRSARQPRGGAIGAAARATVSPDPVPHVMHEMSDRREHHRHRLRQRAVRAHGRRDAVRVRVGSLSGVVAESLAFCFRSARGRHAAGSGPARRRVGARPNACCGDCGRTFEPSRDDLPVPGVR